MKVTRRFEKATPPQAWLLKRKPLGRWFRAGWFWTATDNSGGFGYGLTRYDAMKQCQEQKGWR